MPLINDLFNDVFFSIHTYFLHPIFSHVNYILPVVEYFLVYLFSSVVYTAINKGEKPTTAKNYHPKGDGQMTGNEFKELRKRQGLTQKGLAAPLNVTYQTLQKWEGKADEQADIPARHWNELANRLCVSVDAFYPSPEQKPSINANGNATVIFGGRTANQINNEPQFILRPMERQAIELNREFGNDSIMKGFIGKLLKIKTLADDMF